MRNEYVYIETGSVCLLSDYRDGKRIDRIWTPPHQRGKGGATRLMRAVIAHADAEGLPLRLIACADMGTEGLNDWQLTIWYKSFGFEDDSKLHYVRHPKCYA